MQPAELASVASHVLSGASKGFFMYFLPLSLLQRKNIGTIARRAAAISAFTSTVRVGHKVYKLYLDPKLSAPEKQEQVSEYVPKMVQQVLAKQNIFLSLVGAASVLVACLVDPSLPSSVFVFWLLIRAIRAVTPNSVAKNPFVSVAVMCVAASQVMTTWIIARDELDPMYARFMDKHGRVGPSTIRTMIAHDDTIPCSIVHPGKGCSHFATDFFRHSFLQSAQLYLPQYLIMIAVTRKFNFMALLKNLARSSLFLTLFCTIAWVSTCVFYRQSPGLKRHKLYSHMWLCGLALLVERPSRRAELAGYVSTYAADAGLRFLMKRGLPQIPGAGMLTLMVAVGTLLYHHESQPRLLTNWLLGLREMQLKENAVAS